MICIIFQPKEECLKCGLKLSLGELKDHIYTCERLIKWAVLFNGLFIVFCVAESLLPHLLSHCHCHHHHPLIFHLFLFGKYINEKGFEFYCNFSNEGGKLESHESHVQDVIWVATETSNPPVSPF